MNNKEIMKAIQYLKPNAEYTFNDDDYSTIQWIELEGEAPTLAELKAALEEVLANEQTEAETKATQKAALLERLGISEDEARLLLS
jgi:hypothetical protein